MDTVQIVIGWRATGGSAPLDAPSVSSDVLEQIPPLRSDIGETALRIPLRIRTRPAYQLGEGLIVEIESVSHAFA
jgi:hypothetical protein